MPGLTPSNGGGRFGAPLRGVVLRMGESFGRDWGPAGHLWIPACTGMTGVRAWVAWRIRGLAQGNSLTSLGFARDDNRRARVDRAWMERAGFKPAPTRGCVVSWGRAVREPLLRGVVLRIGESFGRDWVRPGTSGYRPAPV